MRFLAIEIKPFLYKKIKVSSFNAEAGHLISFSFFRIEA